MNFSMNCTAECCPNRDLQDEKLITLITIKTLVIIFAICGNSLVFRAFCKFSSLRTASNVILVSLCAANSLIAIVYIINISKLALKLSGSNDQHRSNGICEASAWFSFILLSVIILHLALISFERLIAVKFPLRYHSIVTNRRALFASVTAWLWAVAVTFVFPQALRASNDDAYNRLVHALHPCLKTKRGRPDGLAPPLSTGYLIFLVTSMLIIPLVIILSSYGYIFNVSHKHRKQIRQQDNIQGISTIKREMRGAHTLAIVVAVCLLSIVPLLICTILRFFGKLPDNGRRRRQLMRHIVYDFAFGLNAICNPLIYGWRNGQFRSAFRRLLKCC